MQVYSYVAVDANGDIKRGMQPFESGEQLRSYVASQRMKLLSFQIQAASWQLQLAKLFLGLRSELAQRVPATSMAVESTLEQLAMMLGNHIGILEAIDLAGKQTTSYAMQVSLNRIGGRIANGTSLEQAFESEPIFPKFLGPLIAVGERSGQLDLVLKRCAKQIANRRKNRNAIVGAFAYPTLVLTAALGVAVYLLIMVIPQLQKLLASLGRRLPAMTQSLVDVAAFLQANSLVLGGLTIAGIVACILFYRSEYGRRWFDRYVLSVPLAGSLLRLSATYTFSSFLNVMLKSGMSLIDCLDSLTRLHSNCYISERIEAVRQLVVGGSSLSEAVDAQKVFTPMLSSMIAVGEKTGELEEVMQRVADFNDEQLVAKIKRWNAIMEPTILILVGIVVGYVYMAFFVALFSVGGKFR